MGETASWVDFGRRCGGSKVAPRLPLRRKRRRKKRETESWQKKTFFPPSPPLWSLSPGTADRGGVSPTFLPLPPKQEDVREKKFSQSKRSLFFSGRKTKTTSAGKFKSFRGHTQETSPAISFGEIVAFSSLLPIKNVRLDLNLFYVFFPFQDAPSGGPLPDAALPVAPPHPAATGAKQR